MGILDWLYPKRCVGCGREGSYICAKCREGIGVRGGGLCYEGVVRKVIKEIKYRGSYDMVEELVGIWEDKCSVTVTPCHDNVVVTSVPMWEQKKRVRGFNQAELIARAIAKRWRLPYQEMLVRERETRAMYGLKRKDRRENVRGAFGINNQCHSDTVSRAILVDDVWTSGATLEECSNVLRDAGVKMIRKLALAR